MFNLVIFGPPGSGKGTQSEKIIEKYQFAHISTGDVFRENIKNNTALGQSAKQYIDAGELVPDEITIKMLKAENDKFPHAQGVILDGYPRTVPQAEALDTILEADAEKVDIVIQLEVPEETIRDRIAHRAKTSNRTDDEAEKVERRINEYFTKTIQVIPYYDAQGKVHKINGVGDIDAIFEHIVQAIESIR